LSGKQRHNLDRQLVFKLDLPTAESNHIFSLKFISKVGTRCGSLPETGNYFSQLGSKILSGEKFSYQNRKPLFEKVTKNISGNNFETNSNGTQNYFFA